MIRPETFVDRLKHEAAKHAHDALSQPGDRSSFEYGRACGVYAGLLMAAELVAGVYADFEERGSRL